jgi:hypothetical protein
MKIKKSEIMAAVLEMVKIDDEVCRLQDLKKKIKSDLYETYGKNCLEVFKLPSVTSEGHAFLRVETEEVIKEEVSYKFLKKQPDDWKEGKK